MAAARKSKPADETDELQLHTPQSNPSADGLDFIFLWSDYVCFKCPKTN